MNILENFRLAIRGLVSNGMRSILTVLGIFIGVLSVILGTAIGQGARVKILERVQGLGANSLIIFSSQDMEGKAAGDRPRITSFDAEEIAANCPSLVRVAPGFSGTARLKNGRRTANVQISSSTPEYAKIRELTINRGQMYSARDVAARRKVVVLGEELGRKLFGPNVDTAAMVGRRIRIEGISFQVIGVFKIKGAGIFEQPDNMAFVPLSTGMKTLFGAKDPSEIHAQIVNERATVAAQAEISKVLRRTHRLKKGEKDDFQVFTQQQLVSLSEGVAGILTALLAGIAAIALLVGGIGIMNIMLVSVTERTREIGIRKAIGARPRDIRLQFLVEATTLSIGGGLMGIFAGILLSIGIRAIFNFPASVSPFWAALAFFVSAAIGIFFGLYPASKAAKLDPIEALRFQ